MAIAVKLDDLLHDRRMTLTERRANGAQADESSNGTLQMKDSLTLAITSLLSILVFAFHLSDDIVRGFEPGGFNAASPR